MRENVNTGTEAGARRDRLRIAYVSTDPGVPVFGSKGASVHVQEILSALVMLGADVKLFSSSMEGSRQTISDRVEVHGLDWPRGKLAGAESAVEAANQSLRGALEENGPFDLVYERYALWGCAGMEYALSKNIPGLLEVNSPLIEEEARYRELRNRPYAEVVARRALRASTGIVAVSNGVAAYLSRFSEAAGKVRVVPNGVNPARFPADVKPSRPAPPGVFTVGFLGSLKPWHGLETLVEAYGMLHERSADTRLLVVGDGPERDALTQSLAARGLSDSTEFTGKVAPSEVPALIASMDVGVAPYPALEGFYFSPLKVLEYMAAGKPAVASRVGDLHELVEDDVDGILTPPGDAASLEGALARLMSDPKLRAAMGAAGRRKVLASRTWDMVARMILEMGGVSLAEAPRRDRERTEKREARE